MTVKRLVSALVLALLGFVLILAVASEGLKAGRLNAPAWALASVAAVSAMAAMLAKKPAETISAILARPLERWQSRHQDVLTSAPGWLVDPVDGVEAPLALGIHDAIPLPDGTDLGLLTHQFPMLPEYVPRDIDADLRTWIRAHQADGGFVVLVGPAASGKTRCLYEALRAEVPNWSLIRPGNGREINERAQDREAFAQSVLWLDDLPEFLRGDALTSATVQHLLTRSGGPVLLAGTIWPEDLDRLLARPTAGESNEINENAHSILRILGYWSSPSPRAIRFDVADAFTTSELARAELVAARDPRLEIAIRDADNKRITATLAASEDLIYHWTRSDGHRDGQAIITAAVIARLCGHPEPVPTQVLQPVALALMAAEGAAPATVEWLADALAYAVNPPIGKVSALRTIRTAPGIVDGYKISDILVQRWDEGPRQQIIAAAEDDATWDLLLAHCTLAASVDIGFEAYANDKVSIAERIWLKAAGDGRTDAMTYLGRLYWRQGNDANAQKMLADAANLGDHGAMTDLGDLFARHGDMVQAERWLRRGAERGDSFTMGSLAFFLAGRGQDAEAEHWYRKAAQLGDANAMANLGYMLAKRGLLDEAERWDRQGADLGHVGAMENLGNLLRDRGDRAEALTWYRRAAERSYAIAVSDPYWLHPWPGEAGDEGLSNSILALADNLAENGDAAEAERWYRRLADLGDARAASQLAELTDDQGNARESSEWRRKAAELAYENLRTNKWSLLSAYGESAVRRHTEIMINYANRLATQGFTAEATTWYERAEAHGQPSQKPPA